MIIQFVYGKIKCKKNSFKLIFFFSNGTSKLIKCHNDKVNSVNFSHDSNCIVTGSNDKKIKIFSIYEKKFKGNFIGHLNYVNEVKFSKDSNLIVSCSNYKTVKL